MVNVLFAIPATNNRMSVARQLMLSSEKSVFQRTYAQMQFVAIANGLFHCKSTNKTNQKPKLAWCYWLNNIVATILGDSTTECFSNLRTENLNLKSGKLKYKTEKLTSSTEKLPVKTLLIQTALFQVKNKNKQKYLNCKFNNQSPDFRVDQGLNQASSETAWPFGPGRTFLNEGCPRKPHRENLGF